MKYLFTNLIGIFVLDQDCQIIDRFMFKDGTAYLEKENEEKKIHQKYPGLQTLNEGKLSLVLGQFKDRKYYSEFYEKNIFLTKLAIQKSVNEDQLIIQTISNIKELDRVNNLLVKRLREWYSLYLPELAEEIASSEKFVEKVICEAKVQLIKEMNVRETMGADLKENDVKEIVSLAEDIARLFDLRRKHELYLKDIMQNYCPNLLELAGTTIGASLIELGKGLKHLALLPSSTVQLLGAEKALFRHLKTGSRSPKYGFIHAHPLIQEVGKEMKGKAARSLADKLSLCARLDYFKGEFKALDYRKELEEKFARKKK